MQLCSTLEQQLIMLIGQDESRSFSATKSACVVTAFENGEGVLLTFSYKMHELAKAMGSYAMHDLSKQDREKVAELLQKIKALVALLTRVDALMQKARLTEGSYQERVIDTQLKVFKIKEEIINYQQQLDRLQS